MKKIMWIVAVLPVVVASMMLQVIPDMIPHKIGIFIFPIVILCVTFFWHLLIGTFEKKTVKANTDKERMEANSSARVLCVVGLSQAIMFGIMNYCILYSSCVQENVNDEVEQISYLDGVKLYLKNGGWISVRFSGTEPLLRIFCEMPEAEDAKQLCEIFEDYLLLKK